MCASFLFFACFAMGQLQAQYGFDYLVIHLKENTVVMERVEQNILERVKQSSSTQAVTKSKSTDRSRHLATPIQI
jgi:hypothetical protein